MWTLKLLQQRNVSRDSLFVLDWSLEVFNPTTGSRPPRRTTLYSTLSFYLPPVPGDTLPSTAVLPESHLRQNLYLWTT